MPAKEIAKKHCLEYTRKEFPNQEFEDHYDAPEWMINAMKEYAREACKEQRELCDVFIEEHKEGVEKYNLLPKMKLAPSPDLK